MRKKYQSTKLDPDHASRVWRGLCNQLWRWEMREAPRIESDDAILDAICTPSMRAFLKEVPLKADISYYVGNEYTKINFLDGMVVNLHVIDRTKLPLPLHPELQDNEAGRMLRDYLKEAERVATILDYHTQTFDTLRYYANDWEHLRLILSTAPIIWEAAGSRFPVRCRDPNDFTTRWSSTVSPDVRQRVDELDSYFLNLSFILNGRMEQKEVPTQRRVSIENYRWD